jgi:multiple sugar transport system ATP-binding protein
MGMISLQGVVKRYPNGFEAVKGIDLDVAEGEFVVLVGPSGCGKTTLLRMVAGLEEITEGELRIGGELANEVAPMNRDIAMVFQNYALYPHMTVAANIGFPLKLQKLPKAEIRRRVESAADVMGLSDLLDQKPGSLSGGQRQRVAMGRALVREPVAFLMDEPLSNLDARLRVQMRAEIRRLQRRLGVATLYVTHDQTEAMTMGDRVAVLRDGTIRQFASPQHLYDRPAEVFVAGFIGSPAMNLYRVDFADDPMSIKLGSQMMRLSTAILADRPGLEGYAGRSIIVGFRPEHLTIDGDDQDASFEAEVNLVEPLGSDVLVHFSLDAANVASVQGELGTPLALDDLNEGICLIEASRQPRPGERRLFTIPASRIHFFDGDTEQAIWS